MKKQFLIGMVFASFSLSAYAQTSENLEEQGFFSPQSGVSVQFNKKGQMEAIAGEAKTSSDNMGMGMGIGSDGIGDGAPDLSHIQAQAIANAQALDKPVDLRAAPDGAEAILKQGANALQIKDSSQLQSLPTQSNNSLIPSEFFVQDNSKTASTNGKNGNGMAIKSVNQVKRDIYTTDISMWNKTTIEQFEKEGKERTEKSYKEFLSK